jgi:hypothetical protein
LAFTTTGGLLFSASSIVGNLLDLPENWNPFLKLMTQAFVGAGVVLGGNLSYYSGLQIALSSGSGVNSLALRAYLNFVNITASYVGMSYFFNQPMNWTIWVGMGALATVAALQIGYSIGYPNN